MFYDLNVDVPVASRSEAAQTCARLGYDVIAFNSTVNSRKLGEEHLPVIFVADPTSHALPYDAQVIRVANSNSRGRCTVRVLQRITLQIEDVSQLPCLSSPVLTKYDIVAVAPASEKILQQCLQFDVDVICLPFSQKHNFHLKRPQLHVAKEKGVAYEIPYTGVLGDASARRSMIGNVASAVRVTGGKHMVLSSGAKTSMQIRGPHDVINLGRVFGLSAEHSRNGVTRVSEEVVTHGDIRSRTYKGILRPVGKASAPVSTSEMTEI